MPTPLYNYVPIYGVEKHLPDLPSQGGNGGARVDNDNLIITAWEVDTKNTGGSATPFVFGDLVIPRYASEGVSDAEGAAWTTPMTGRVGARFLLSTLGSGFDRFIVLVLAPPEELKQQLAGSVVFNGGDTLDVASYTFSKSHVGQFAWKGLLYDSRDDNSNGLGGFDFNTSLAYQIGSYVPLNLYGSAPNGAYLPLLKTNGADGVAPVAFNMTTADGVAECITAVNQGSFFIPMVVEEVDFDNPGAYFDIWWPHSVNRG